jgi:hypothetical protein
VLVRDSVPGAAWSFVETRWRHFGPVVDDFGYDSKVCEKLRAKRRMVAALDLAEHEWGMSSHDNEPMMRADTEPLDRKKWGV